MQEFEFEKGPKPITLRGDCCGAKPIYFSILEGKVLSSESAPELLKKVGEKRKLKISKKALSFLLLNGVIPQPLTIYENIHILSIGDTAKFNLGTDNVIRFDTTHSFPYRRRNSTESSKPSTENIIKVLKDSLAINLDPSNKQILFLSGGKDSIPIAVAASQMSLPNLQCVTYSRPGPQDESEIASEVTKQLGLKHVILKLDLQLNDQAETQIDYFFTHSPFPCLDLATIGYPLFANEIEWKNSQVLDGMGNDVFIGHIPGTREWKRSRISIGSESLQSLALLLSDVRPWNRILTTRSEATGLDSGLTYKHCRRYFPEVEETYSYWCSESRKRKDWDYLDLRANIRGCVIDQEKFIRKIRNPGDVYGFETLLPWCDIGVINYCFNLPESALFDRKELKNKLILRELLRKYLQLDPDKIGKRNYSFDFESFVTKNRSVLVEEIKDCSLWSKNIDTFINDELHKLNLSDKKKTEAAMRLYSLYLVSAWSNRCKYLS